MYLNYINDKIISKINSDIFDENDVKSFILGFINFLGLEDYLVDIIIDNLNNKKILAKYDFETMNLRVDLVATIEDAKDGYASSSDGELILFVNIMILFSLTHEITHIYQNAHKKDQGIYSYIIRREFSLFKILSFDEYYKYWGLFTAEREAVINSFEYVLFVLRNFTNNNEMYEYFLENLICNLTEGYKIKKGKIEAPVQFINRRFIKGILPVFNSNDIYTSLKYGYPVDKEELKIYKENKEEIVEKKLLATM